MKRPFQVLLLILSGLGLLYATLFTDLSLRYVKEGMRPILIASGALLLLLGAAEAWSSWWRGGGDEHEEPHGRVGHDSHDHSGVPRVAWLLFLPALSLLFYAPPALGAYSASRAAPRAVTEQEHFDALPETSPVPMTLTDFTRRVRQDRTRVIKGRSVRMVGFVTPDQQGDGWSLTRLVLNCCAADAQSVIVRIHGTPALPANTWVSVTGTWHPGGRLGTESAPVALDGRTVKKVARPVNGYKDALPLTPS